MAGPTEALYLQSRPGLTDELSEKSGASMHSEEWCSVVGHPNYDVSSHGRVRSWKESWCRRKSDPPLIMRLGVADKMPYLQITLDGKSRFVHQLVLEAFVGPCPFQKKNTRHLDSDPQNNHLENLAWGTWSDQMEDKRGNGTFPALENHPMTHRDRELVQAIRDEHGPPRGRGYRHKPGEVSVRDLSIKYNIPMTTIQHYLHRRTWDV